MIRIFPPTEMIETTVTRLPLSKSVAARALILAAMSGDTVDEAKLPECNDINVLKEALANGGDKADVADSGTALRFLTAFYAATEGREVTVTGTERLCERPISPLVEALRSLGADITYIDREGYAPLRISGKRLEGGEVSLNAGASSQFASALALAAPLMKNGLVIHLGGQIPSMPYLKMTLSMLEARGVEAYIEGYDVYIRPSDKPLKATEQEAEPDWSAASYWYAIAGVSAGWVTLPGLAAKSLQGDSVLKDIGDRFGVVTEFTDDGAELSATPDIYSRLDMDLSDWPDLVPALAVTGALTRLPFVFTGVGNLRHKESDRIAALTEGLAQLGIVTSSGADTFSWEGERVPIMKMPEIDPHGDHRIAMAFAVASLALPGIAILHPEVVEKSYPGFWADLSDAGFTICRPGDPVPEEFLPRE